MNNFIKFAAVGIAGYWIGFYEAKHKCMKIILETIIEQNNEEKKQKKED